jgi:hypothetical protein
MITSITGIHLMLHIIQDGHYLVCSNLVSQLSLASNLFQVKDIQHKTDTVYSSSNANKMLLRPYTCSENP